MENFINLLSIHVIHHVVTLFIFYSCHSSHCYFINLLSMSFITLLIYSSFIHVIHHIVTLFIFYPSISDSMIL